MHARSHLRRAVAGTLAALTLGATAGLAAPAHADRPGPWERYSYAVGSLAFQRLGVVPGQPGNAHSGNAGFDTSDDPVVVNLYDWDCPAGVLPPTDLGRATPCTLLRARYADGGQAQRPMPAFTGPLSARFVAALPVTTDLGAGGDADLPVALRWRRTGAITSTVTEDSTADFQSTIVRLEAPMRVSGRLGWVRLADPRNHVRLLDYWRETLRYRARSAG